MKINPNHSLWGKLLNGRYKIIESLSAGAFGKTYIAEDTRQQGHPRYVIKYLQPKSDDPQKWQFLKRLWLNEAQTLIKLGSHNQIPRLVDYFEDHQGFYLVQNLIVGETLSTELPISQNSNKRFSENQCIELLEDVLGILEFIHRQGIIHRDLKPNNLIRRGSDRRLVLIDFGAAELINSKPIKAHLTEYPWSDASSTIRPFAYIPPEQLAGQSFPNSDIYSLGMIAIHALTGMTPMQLADPETGEIHWRNHVSVSDKMAFVLNHMVSYNSKLRYQSANDALIVLKTLMSTQSPELKVSIAKSDSELITEHSALSIKFSDNDTLEFKVLDTQSDSELITEHSALSIEFSDNDTFELSVLDTQSDSRVTIEDSALTRESSSQELKQAAPLSDSGVKTEQETLSTQDSQTSNNESEISNYEPELHWKVYVREFALYSWPKLPPLLKRIGVGAASSNGIAILIGLYALLNASASRSEFDILQKAIKHYQAGDLEEAIALAESIPSDSLIYEQSLNTVQQWQQQWQGAEALFKATEQAFYQERWSDVLEGYDKMPSIGFWQKKMEPLVKKAKPRLEAEAQGLLKQAYKQALAQDFSNAIALLEQIHPETPTGAKVQPKLKEYQQKQQIRAEYLLQEAYEQGGQGNFIQALVYLSQIPKETPTYQKARIKIAEYSRKQHLKEEVERQAALARAVLEKQRQSGVNQKPLLKVNVESSRSPLKHGLQWQEVND
ncbi:MULTISPECIES: serine/threonine-protein kinase [unclassified Moorena]|uniref:serine/threonine-protein kinase n=1 Tax=unclassified Moorena TaxID=2683338 RepID=UPI0013FF33CD|nr:MULTISPECIES: serine/threonine-protein kinase [unclassified Moorena]NEO11874.1 serine/threonine protein kinase [Moorena sp. SIO3E8]NEP98792.1 serine/threonine protein kinase [Moorena sp. SIO3F7]